MILQLLWLLVQQMPDLLILLSDIDGLYTHDPRKTKSAILIKIVEEITSEIMVAAGGAGSKLGSGGMLTKIEAAKISGNSGGAAFNFEWFPRGDHEASNQWL